MKRTKLNYDDYARLPNDGKTHEIIDGAHYNHPAPRIKHQRISANLDLLILPHVRATRLGEWLSAPTDVLLGEYDIVQPDKVFVSAAQRSIITELNIQGVPDLLVEITSPINPGYDRETKMALYARYAVMHYWIVDAQIDVLEVYRHVGPGFDLAGRYRGSDVLEPELFPGLGISMTDVFSLG